MNMIVENLDEGLLQLTFNRPEQRNALSRDMAEQLAEILRRARLDPAVRAILLTGSGPAFCVGGDIQAIADCSGQPSTMEQQVAELEAASEAVLLLHQMPKPAIAGLHGGVAGAGLALALACDIRIAGDDIKLTPAFSRIALSGDFGSSYFLHMILGARARYFCMTSPILKAADALSYGLVDEVVPAADMEARALSVARQLAQGPTIALGHIKQNLNFAQRGNSLADVLHHEALLQIRCSQTGDHAEGAAAFFEKRASVFLGR